MDDATFAPGATMGRYVILDKLGEGGMGVVYRARDSQLNRIVALKVLRPTEGMDAASWIAARARLLREAQAAAATSHPAIVTLFDIGEVDGRPFLAMEYIEGRTLRELMAAGPLPRDQSLAWLHAVASALGAAHREGIIHRDVKPENVMVRRDGAVKVLDFGIARSAPAGTPLSARTTPQLPTLTREGAVVGTVAYMAPEQIGGEELDGRADQFAWGVLAYEIFTGTSPWTVSSDPLVTITSILTKEPRPLGDVVPDLPPDVRSVVARAMTKDRSTRFASMADLLAVWPPPAAGSGPYLPLARVSRDDLASLEQARTESAAVIDSRRAPTTPLSRGRWRWRQLMILALALPAAVFAAVSFGRLKGKGAVSGLGADAAEADRPITLLDLPPPTSTSAAALAAYREGLVAERAGVNDAYKRFEKAVSADPDLAAAYVQIMVTLAGAPGPDNQAATLDAYRHALLAHDHLSKRDRDLLDGYEPVVFQQPPDWGACEAKLRAIVSASPMDADLTGALGAVLMMQNKVTDADAMIARALALDPGDVQLWILTIEGKRLHSDLAGARTSAEGCVKASPGSTQCLAELLDLDGIEGKCDDTEAVVLRYIAISPEDPWGYINQFESQLARGAAEGAMVAVEARMLAHIDPALRPWAEIHYPFVRAEARGDFGEGQRLLGLLDARALREHDIGDQLRALFERSELALELGDLAGAGVAAAAYFDMREAVPERGATYAEISRDYVPRVLSALRQTGRITAVTAAERRDRWLHDWRARAPEGQHVHLWLEAYARPAETLEDAEEAIAHAPEELQNLSAGMTLEPYALGRMYLLAGQIDKALPLLEIASKQCFMRRFPLDIPRASYFLGLAREAKGDKLGACAAYRTVISRWGHATPASVTATLSTKHASALACGPEPGQR